MTPQLLEDPKRVVTPKGRAELVGTTVHSIEIYFSGKKFVASRWVLNKAFSSMDAIEVWSDWVTGKGTS